MWLYVLAQYGFAGTGEAEVLRGDALCCPTGTELAFSSPRCWTEDSIQRRTLPCIGQAITRGEVGYSEPQAKLSRSRSGWYLAKAL
jgi:hypothetical protein